jgi:hypothetical protein
VGISTDLCSLFRQNPVNGRAADRSGPNSAAPTVTGRVAAVLKKAVTVKGAGASGVDTLEPLG